jgi:Zn-dependent M16 (insulinase) family peptidase
LREEVMGTLKETSEKGFDKCMVNSVLNMIEMNCKDQKENFGIQLSETLIGFFNYQNISAVANFLEISGKNVNIRQYEGTSK